VNELNPNEHPNRAHHFTWPWRMLDAVGRNNIDTIEMVQ